MDNNRANIFNAFIMNARYMPIVSMLKEIFKSVITRITIEGKKKLWAAFIEHPISPRIMKKLEEKKMLGFGMPSAGSGYYNVTHGVDAFIVRLTEMSYSCKLWEVVSMIYNIVLYPYLPSFWFV